jgi:type I restriction enzyme S subunit
LRLIDKVEQRILARAFAGYLVEQDPDDEPADRLLDRIRQLRAISAVEAPKRPKAKAMKADPKQAIVADSNNWPKKGLAFEAIAQRVLLPYSDLRDAIFELLSGTSPTLMQVFDEGEKRMLLRRVEP